jgi:gamma-glutamylcyclotransferase (GGCT)/AIG2-like uncharacterized protein YtfP
MTNKVFVYGTLQGGNSRRGLNQFPGAVFQGKATTSESGFHLIDLGAFPAVVPGGDSDVSGEVWHVDDDTMETLDAIEGYPEFYSRRLTETSLGTAWMYYIKNSQRYQFNLIEPENGISTWMN